MNPHLPTRKRLRLLDFDYSTEAIYFITLVTQSRLPLFGDIIAEKSVLNPAGGAIEEVWRMLPERFISVEIDEYCIMPNHVHAILMIHQSPGISLPSVVGWFKSMTTHVYIQGVQQHDWIRFDGKLWQRSYYDHIVRDEDDLNRVRQYIFDNPLQWSLDRENPKSIP